MENPLRKQIRSIMKDHKKRQMWYRIVTTLAVVVVFVTTYMLILPAITMENKAECGITNTTQTVTARIMKRRKSLPVRQIH